MNRHRPDEPDSENDQIGRCNSGTPAEDTEEPEQDPRGAKSETPSFHSHHLDALQPLGVEHSWSVRCDQPQWISVVDVEPFTVEMGRE